MARAIANSTVNMTRAVLIAAVTGTITFFAGAHVGRKDEIHTFARIINEQAENTRQAQSFCAVLPTHYRCWMNPWDRDELDESSRRKMITMTTGKTSIGA